MISLFQVVLLGVIQGLTEFLPVSSSGHLALTQILFNLEGGLTLSVLMHAGTLVAVVAVLRRSIAVAAVEGAAAVVAPRRFRETVGGRDALVVIVASLPTALVGLTMHDAVAIWSQSPTAIGIGFLTTAALLASTRFAAAGKDEVPSVVGALALGFAQAAALLPGISRSGATITMALWLGVRPDRAFELSMLMSLPAVLGALILEVGKIEGVVGGVGMALAGAATACVVGVLALMVLRRIVVKGHFSIFALWVVPLGIATLALARAWPSTG